MSLSQLNLSVCTVNYRHRTLTLGGPAAEFLGMQTSLFIQVKTSVRVITLTGAVEGISGFCIIKYVIPHV